MEREMKLMRAAFLGGGKENALNQWIKCWRRVASVTPEHWQNVVFPWGKQADGVTDNHARVREINDALAARGWTTWFDESGDMREDIEMSMSEGIQVQPQASTRTQTQRTRRLPHSRS